MMETISIMPQMRIADFLHAASISGQRDRKMQVTQSRALPTQHRARSRWPRARDSMLRWDFVGARRCRQRQQPPSCCKSPRHHKPSWLHGIELGPPHWPPAVDSRGGDPKSRTGAVLDLAEKSHAAYA
jgi:hypothetical protein